MKTHLYFCLVSSIFGMLLIFLPMNCRAQTPPGTVSNCIFWLDADNAAPQTNGSAITAWTDASTSALPATVGSSAPLVETNAYNGHSCVRFTTTLGQYLDYGNPTVFNNLASGDYTVVMVASDSTAQSLQNYETLFSKTSGSAASRFWLMAEFNGLMNFGTGEAFGPGWYTSTPFVYVYQFHLTGTNTGTETNIRNNSVVYSDVSTSVPAWDSTDHVRVGMNPSNSYGWNGDILNIAVYSRLLTNSEISGIEQWEEARYAIAGQSGLDTSQEIVFDGNSVTVGFEVINPANNFAEQSINGLGGTQPRWKMYNFGTGGITTGQLISRAPSLVDPHASDAPKTILVANEGINDLVSNPPTTCYTNLKTYCSARKADGFSKVILQDVTPNAYDTESNRLAMNALLRADFPTTLPMNPLIRLPGPGVTYADALIDVAQNGNIGLSGQNSNLTFYNTDSDHPNSAGDAVIAGAVADAIQYFAKPKAFGSRGRTLK